MISTHSLFYRKNNTKFGCNLYTSSSETGMSDFINIYHNGILYLPIGDISDIRASSLRIKRNGAAKAILCSLGNWVEFGSKAVPPNGLASTVFDVSTDYYKTNPIAGPNDFYNIKIQYSVSDSGEGVSPQVTIDGTTYSVTPGTGTFYQYFRLSTGTHNITLYAYRGPKPPDDAASFYSSVGYCVG